MEDGVMATPPASQLIGEGEGLGREESELRVGPSEMEGPVGCLVRDAGRQFDLGLIKAGIQVGARLGR